MKPYIRQMSDKCKTAEGLESFLKRPGLGDLPVTDLNKIMNEYLHTSGKPEENGSKSSCCGISCTECDCGQTSVPLNETYECGETHVYGKTFTVPANTSYTDGMIVFGGSDITGDVSGEYTECDNLASDDIINYVAPVLPIDGDDCVFNLSMMTFDGKTEYVVTYERISDGWPCLSFTGETLKEVLSQVALYSAPDCE